MAIRKIGNQGDPLLNMLVRNNHYLVDFILLKILLK